MKGHRRLSALNIAIVSVLIAVPSSAQIIDRIMAVVSNHIITLSDVAQERHIREVLADNGPNDDKTILNDLINAHLIETEIGQSAAVDVTEDQIDKELSRITDLHGISPSLLREAIRRRLRASEFFDLRFRQAIRASDDDIKKYYDEVFAPEARKRGVNPVPSLDQVSDLIQKNIVEEKTVHEVDAWLDETRQRSDVEIFP